MMCPVFVASDLSALRAPEWAEMVDWEVDYARRGRRRLHSQPAHRLRRSGHPAVGNSADCAGSRV